MNYKRVRKNLTMKIRYLFIFMAAPLSFSTVVEAQVRGTYSHRMTQVPIYGGSCQATAATYADHFAKQTGNDPYRSVGKPSLISKRVPDPWIVGGRKVNPRYKIIQQASDTACDIEFVYVGRPIFVYSIPENYQYEGPSYYQFTLPKSYGFTNPSTCQANLADRISSFQNATSLEIFAAYCAQYSIDPNSGDELYLEHIEAIGAPATSYFKWVIPAVQSQTRQWILNQIMLAGGKVVASFDFKDFGSTMGMTFFHATQMPRLSLNFISYDAGYEAAADCEQTITDLQSIYAVTGNLLLETQCELRLGLLRKYVSLKVVTQENKFMSRVEPPLNKYDSFEQCRLDRQPTINFLMSQNPKKTYHGAICYQSRDLWRMDIFAN